MTLRRSNLGGWIVGLALASCASTASTSDAGATDAPVERPAGPRESPIVINEIGAGATSWIELYNDSDARAELGSQLLRASSEFGAPYLLVTNGSSLAPRQFVVITLDPPDPGAPCDRDGGASLCLSGGFVLDGVRGGRITVMRFVGPALQAVDYPADLAARGATWGRAPDGSGAFALTNPTPGAPNDPR